jgi:ribonuclease HI
MIEATRASDRCRRLDITHITSRCDDGTMEGGLEKRGCYRARKRRRSNAKLTNRKHREGKRFDDVDRRRRVDTLAVSHREVFYEWIAEKSDGLQICRLTKRSGSSDASMDYREIKTIQRNTLAVEK